MHLITADAPGPGGPGGGRQREPGAPLDAVLVGCCVLGGVSSEGPLQRSRGRRDEFVRGGIVAVQRSYLRGRAATATSTSATGAVVSREQRRVAEASQHSVVVALHPRNGWRTKPLAGPSVWRSSAPPSPVPDKRRGAESAAAAAWWFLPSGFPAPGNPVDVQPWCWSRQQNDLSRLPALNRSLPSPCSSSCWVIPMPAS